MRAGNVRDAGPTSAQKRAYGIAAGRACEELGIRGAEACREYRRKVVLEATGREGFAEIRSNADIDAVMQRLWTDAGDYQQAAKFCVNYERQMAYVIKVMAIQLMQLKGTAEELARDYIGGILDQARVPNGRNLDDGCYWLDIRPDQISNLLKILDTERRKILKRFGETAGRFSDGVKFALNVSILTRVAVERGYYAAAPFKVIVRAA